MQSASDRTFKLGLILSVLDWLTFNAVIGILYGALFLSSSSHTGHTALNLLMANISYVLALQIVNIGLHHRYSKPADVLSNTSRTSFFFIVFYTSLLGMFGNEVPSVWSSICIALLVFVTTTVERLIMRRIVIRHRGTNEAKRVKTIIIGTGDLAQRIVDVMQNPWNGYRLLGYFSQDEAETLADSSTGESLIRLGDKNDVMAYIESHEVDEVYIGVRPEWENEFKPLLLLCDSKMIRTYYIPTTAYKEFRKARIVEIGDVYVMSRRYEPLKDMRNKVKKRVFDFIVSLVFVCTLFPIILIAVAIISKITMPGPLFFKQKRTGYDGKDFWCYKFRSMRVNKEADTQQAVKNDPRITKWGEFMRHTNIDEFPQFLNVLKGDMSIVGPRPHMLAHTEYYSNLISDYMIRHYVKPGITGWAQTHGERGETKTVDDMRRRVEKDIWYIEHWSFWLDVQIILKTVYDIVRGDEKAY